MMEGAYFVGRVELLNWLNDFLKLDYTKVEQTCTAAAHCQIFDAIYPEQVPLHKVNFNAKLEYEFVNNFKVLQGIFDKMGIDRHIDVPKLVKGKYQDNLEFLQWEKRYFDLHFAGGEYNAVERRQKAQEKKGVKSTGAPAVAEKKPTPAPAPATTAPATKATKATAPAVKAVKATTTASPAKKTTTTHTTTTTTTTTHTTELETKIQELSENNAELKLTIDNLERERDFYFAKLREIEVLCQKNNVEEDPYKDILKIMYQTDNNEAEEAVPEEQKDIESF